MFFVSSFSNRNFTFVLKRELNMRFFLFFTFIILSKQINASNIPATKRVFKTDKSTVEAPTIDGLLNEDAWKQVSWQDGFLQHVPNEGAKASKITKVSITYDHDNIYVGIVCLDKPENIRKIFTRRDDIEGDAVGIAFDSYFNKRTAFEFILTAAGQKIDIINSGDGEEDRNWNANWDGATAISDSGWSAEFKIPFSQLRYSDKNEHTWGLHIWRYIDKNKEIDHWNLIPVNAPQGVHNYGMLQGIHDIRKSRQAEFLPYVSTKLERNGENENPYIKNYKVVPNAGIDAKLGISSNYTLDLTVNPDFGQVEADPSELNLTAYETFYQEKRPFFLEGQDIFDFQYEGNHLFYSRRIGAAPGYSPDSDTNNSDEYYESPQSTKILASGKLSGRSSNGLSVGFIQTITGNEFGENYIVPKNPVPGQDTFSVNKILAEPLTSYFASRIKKQSEDANTIIGGSFNSVIRKHNNEELQDVMIRSAHTAGLDFQQFFFNKNYFLQAFGMVSHIEGSEKAILQKQESHIHRFQRSDAEHLSLDPNKTSLTGTSGFIRFRKQGGKLNFGGSSGFWSPQLNINDIGFMLETDYIEHEVFIKYRNNEPKKILRSYNAMIYTSNRWTFGNEHTRSNLYGFFNADFTNLWEFEISWEQVFPALDTRVLRGGPALYQEGYQGGNIGIETNSSKRFYLEGYLSYYFNIGNESYLKGYGSEINWNPINKLKLSLDLVYQKNNFAYEFFDAELSDRNIYMIGRLNQQTLSTTLRLEYFIKPEISFQYYGNPYFSAVNYTDIKRVQNSKAKEANQRFYSYTDNELVLNESTNEYNVVETNGERYSFENPDVSFGEFNSNFVFRWEYKLGSVFYVVWSHNQGEYDNINSPHLNDPLKNLFRVPAGDVVMFKLSYWFNT